MTVAAATRTAPPQPPRARDAAGLATRMREGLVGEGAPLPLKEACAAAGVHVTQGSLRSASERAPAMLVPASDGSFTVIVDSRAWDRARRSLAGRRRLRFIVAHELGHTLFYRPGTPPLRTAPPDRDEELFCHRFATALLVARGPAAGVTLDPHSLYALAARYEVSFRVAAWAVARARPEISIMWFCQAPHPTYGGAHTMRLQWGASERFLAAGESLKSELANLPPRGQGVSRERLRLGGRECDLDLEAWRYDDGMLVVARHREDAGDGPAPAIAHQLDLGL